MNKTKKYLLQFIILAFILVGIITVYNMNAHHTKVVTVKKEVQEEVVDDSQESMNQTSNQQESPKSSIKEKKESKSISKQDDYQMKQKSSKEEKKTQENIIESVQVTIRGIDGTISDEKVKYKDGLDAFDVLKSVCDANHIPLETSGQGITVYVKSIQGIKEMQYGPMSGWKYKVNGQMYSKGAGQYQVKSGDHVEWFYDQGQ